MSNMFVVNEYKTLSYNVIFVLSIVMLAILFINLSLITIAPNWIIRLCLGTSVLGSLTSSWLLYKTIRDYFEHRNILMIVEWITSYILLMIGSLPTATYIYLNLDLKLLAKYGVNVFSVYWSVENIILSTVIILLVSLIYWTLTIQLYKKSYTTYLCLNKKKEIYGK